MSANGHLRLFDQLPAVHRLRDAERDAPLEHLLAVAQKPLDLLREDVATLYDNWFIETCEDWVVPYIGDLLGVRSLAGGRGRALGRRGLVANAIAHRRRKGTAAVLEQLAFDVTGWTARAVELFELLAWCQHLDHVRPAGGGTADLRDTNRLELVDGPFDPFAHTPDVRHVDNRRGLHNIPHVALFLWRLESQRVEWSTPVPAGASRYWFDPLRRPLFNRPRSERSIESLAGEVHVEGPLRRRAVRDELLAGVPETVEQDDGRPRFLSPGDPAFAVELAGVRLKPSEISVCDLTDDNRLAPPGKKAAVDPQRGRLVLAAGNEPLLSDVRVTYAYATPGELGGGPYDRSPSVADAIRRAREAWRTQDADAVVWPPFQRGVTGAPGATGQLRSTLQEAVDDWDPAAEPIGIVALISSRMLDEALVTIRVPQDCWLIVAAGAWPKRLDPRDGVTRRHPGVIVPKDVRPHLRGAIRVERAPGVTGAASGRLVVDGLLVEGGVSVAPGALGLLRLSHTTVTGDVTVEQAAPGGDSNVGMEVELERTRTGRVLVASDVTELRVDDAILDAQGAVDGHALRAPGTRISRATVLGAATVRSVHASECIFEGVLDVERRQQGCVRYSWLPPASRAPRRFRCQPDEAAVAAGAAIAFTSDDADDPAYAQLATHCPEIVTRGAEDSGEMGAWHFVGEAHRLAALRMHLDDHLRFGLEAGVFLAT